MRYIVNAKAYGRDAGEIVDLSPSDPLVALNVAVGVLTPDPDAPAEKMTCPACQERLKRPPKLASPDELHAHYEDKHPGLVTPTWASDNEGSEQ